MADRISEVYGEFSPNSTKAEYRTHLMNDIGVLRKYADARRFRALEKNFTKRNFILAVRSALNKAEAPRVTVESIFKGNHARRQTNKVARRKNVISMELDAFLSYWYPHEASEIVLDIVNAVRPMRKITEYFSEDEQI